MKQLISRALFCVSMLFCLSAAHAELIDVRTIQQFNECMTKEYIVIDFYAPFNCGPCNALAPVIYGLAQEYPEVTFLKINGGKLPFVMSQYNVQAYPTLVFLKNGQILEQLRGSKNKSTLKSTISRLFGLK